MVYASLDWYTAILRNMSIKDVLDRLGAFAELHDEMLEEAYRKVVGFNDDFKFRSNGIGIDVSWHDYMEVSEDLSKIVEFKFSKLRLDISGSGLRFLRSLQEDTSYVDKLLSDINTFGDNLVHITRCDFAYDFVNVHESFVDELSSELLNLQQDPFAPRSRGGAQSDLGVEGGKSGQSFTYELKLGNNIKCLYFGTSRSERLIRIYDKKLQLVDKNGAWKKQLNGLVPSFPQDENINSWFRFEIQCRKRWAHEYLFNMNGDPLCILRHIFDTCKFKDPRSGMVFESVRKLFTWSDLPSFMCILHFTELEKPVLQKSEEALERVMSSLLVLYDYYGIDKFYSMIEERINHMNLPLCPRHASQNLVYRRLRVKLRKEHPQKKSFHIREDDGGNLYVSDLRSV